MAPRQFRGYLDWRTLLAFAVENPKQAAIALVTAIVLGLVVLASVTVDAVPVWIAGYALAVVLLVLSYRAAQRLLLVRNASEDPAGDLTVGPTKVHGEVAAATETRVTSPHTGEECIGYHHVRKESSSGGSEEGGQSRSTDQEFLPFYVADDSGRALVDPRDGHPVLKTDDESRSGRTRHFESRVHEGDTVAVYGEVVRPAGGTSVDTGDGGIDTGTDGSTADAVGAVAKEAAAAAASYPGRYADVLESEDRIVSRGPEYNQLVLTDKHGYRVFARQAIWVMLLVAGAVATAAYSTGMAAGLV